MEIVMFKFIKRMFGFGFDTVHYRSAFGRSNFR
jgi:hypothetical protein